MAQTPEGARKIAARRAGITLQEYMDREARGLKWCTGCKDWHPTSEFGRDSTRHDGLAAICVEGRKERYRRMYKPKEMSERLDIRQSWIVDSITYWMCTVCGDWKPPGDFYINHAALSGLSSACKGCKRQQAKRHRDQNPEKVRRCARDYQRSNREELNARARRYSRGRGKVIHDNWRRRNREKIRQRERAYRENNREKLRAKYAVINAIRAGKMERPGFCEMCGKACKPHGHHDSYDKDRRLVVAWLCSRCHVFIHLQRRGLRDAD